MADVKITIPSPVLVSGQSFNVRYRQLPSGSWTDISPKTNAEFTIAGLSAGEYQLEVKLNKGGSPAVLCDAVYDTFVVEESYGCPEIENAEITRSGQQSSIVLSGISVMNPYPCGYDIEYFRVGATGTTTIHRATLPTTLSIPITTPPSDHHIRIYGIICGTNERVLCWEETLVAPTSCDPLVIQSPGASYFKNGNGQYFIRVPFNQSNPASSTITAVWKQFGGVTSGVTDPGGTQVFNGVSPIVIPLNPNINIQHEISGINIGKQMLKYEGGIIDTCGVKHSFWLYIDITKIPDAGGNVSPQPTNFIGIYVNNYGVGSVTYTIEVRERATSTNVAINGSNRTAASGSGNTINGGTAKVKNYNQYDMRITLISAPWDKVFAAKWNNGSGSVNVGSVTVAPSATSAWVPLSDMSGSGGLYIDILESL